MQVWAVVVITVVGSARLDCTHHPGDGLNRRWNSKRIGDSSSIRFSQKKHPINTAVIIIILFLILIIILISEPESSECRARALLWPRSAMLTLRGSNKTTVKDLAPICECDRASRDKAAVGNTTLFTVNR